MKINNEKIKLRLELTLKGKELTLEQKSINEYTKKLIKRFDKINKKELIKLLKDKKLFGMMIYFILENDLRQNYIEFMRLF